MLFPQQLKKNQFKGLRDVETLDLSHNGLTKLDSSHLADLTKLAACNVSFNAIGELTRFVDQRAPWARFQRPLAPLEWVRHCDVK